MQHIDEHTLELFVLGAPEAEPRRAEIDSHLSACSGCRLLVEEMRRFHADLADELEKNASSPSTDSALARRIHARAPRAGEFSPPMRYEPRTPMQKLRYYAVRHPAAAAAAGATMAAMFVGLGMLLMLPSRNDAGSPGITDWAPEFAKTDFAQMQLRVFNKEEQQLWHAELQGEARERQYTEGRGVRFTQVVDLDGDGVKEVVSIASFSKDEALEPRRIRVYNGHGAILRDTSFAVEIPYLDRAYSPYIYLSDLIVLEPGAAGKHELLLSGNSMGRSPRILMRLDEHLNILGSYWHFGDLGPFLRQDIDGDGKAEILAIGENDNDDGESLGEFPVLVTLDPAKIVGTTRSSACPGFRFERSDAERYYVAFPATDLDSANGLHSSAVVIEKADAGLVSVGVGSAETYFHYYLTLDMRFSHAKSNDVLAQAYAKMIEAGKLRTGPTQAKLEALGRRLRYWDGSSWTLVPSQVRNRSSLP